MPRKTRTRTTATIHHQTFEGAYGFVDYVSDNILDYVSLRFNCCTSYREEQNLEQGVIKCGAEIKARKVYEVWTSASAGNAEDCLELGLR